MKNLFIALFLSIILFSCTDDKTNLIKQIDAVTADMKQEEFPSKENMEKVIALYDEYTLTFPEDEKNYDFLELKAKYQAANGEYEDAINTYSHILERYPENEKNAGALFMQAFIYENQLNDKETAKEIYTDFLAKYPNHELASSAQFSLDNLFLSDEEIINKFKQFNQ